jgi:hypothetical protein
VIVIVVRLTDNPTRGEIELIWGAAGFSVPGIAVPDGDVGSGVLRKKTLGGVGVGAGSCAATLPWGWSELRVRKWEKTSAARRIATEAPARVASLNPASPPAVCACEQPTPGVAAAFDGRTMRMASYYRDRRCVPLNDATGPEHTARLVRQTAATVREPRWRQPPIPGRDP